MWDENRRVAMSALEYNYIRHGFHICGVCDRTFQSRQIFDCDLAQKKGWALVRDCTAPAERFVPELLMLDCVPHGITIGEVISQVAFVGNCAGQRHGESIFREQREMPDWRKYSLLFPETEWENPEDSIHYAIFGIWAKGDGWILGYTSLRTLFYPFYRIIHLRR